MRLPNPGDVFENRYEIVDVLGEGGFARVYRARDIGLGRHVALKVIAPRAGEYSDTSKRRFHREAKIIADLQDPHTITLFDFGESADGLLFMAVEFLDGRDLHEIIHEDGPLPPPAVAHILSQVLSSLREAHGRGVLHRDIKPANILVYTYGEDRFAVKLLDFGIAKPLSSELPSITKTGQIIGTPRYMPPEAVFAEPLTAASDLYSLGLVAVEALTGKPAVAGDNVHELVKAHVSGPRVFVPVGLAPPALAIVVERMSARAPDERYRSADEALSALTQGRHEIRGWTPSPTVLAPAPNPPRPPPEVEEPDGAEAEPLSNRALLLTATALVLITIVVGLVAASLFKNDEPAADPAAQRRLVKILRAPPAGEQPKAAKPEKVTAPPPTGCGADQPFVGFGTLEIFEGLDRWEYPLYLPRSYDPDRKNPLIVVFHDVQQTGSVVQRSQMDQLAEEMGAVVFAPVDDSLAVWFDPEDSRRVAEGIEVISTKLCLDRTRFYAFGHGAGGRIAERLHCDFPGEFAATATTAFRPGPGEHSCRPENPTRAISFASLGNQYAPPKGGVGCEYVSAIPLAKNEARWRESNGCANDRKSWLDHELGQCWTWACRNAEFVSCHVEGGREWPGTMPRRWGSTNCDGKPADFPYRETIRRFFEQPTESSPE